MEIVTGIQPDKKSHVVFYGANIGTEKSPIEYNGCVQAMFPHWYPAKERPVGLSMHSELRDFTSEYWAAERAHLFGSYERHIAPLIPPEKRGHYSKEPALREAAKGTEHWPWENKVEGEVEGEIH